MTAVIGAITATALLFIQSCIFFLTMKDARHAAKMAHIDNVAAFNAADRPWVGINQTHLEFEIGKPGGITVTFENFGHSPAFKLQAQFWEFAVSGVGQMCPAIPNDLEPENPSSVTVMFPNQSTGDYLTVTRGKNVAPQDIDLLNSGMCVLKMAGRIDYDDVRGIHHHTTVRGTYDVSLKAFTAD